MASRSFAVSKLMVCKPRPLPADTPANAVGWDTFERSTLKLSIRGGQLSLEVVTAQGDTVIYRSFTTLGELRSTQAQHRPKIIHQGNKYMFKYAWPQGQVQVSTTERFQMTLVDMPSSSTLADLLGLYFLWQEQPLGRRGKGPASLARLSVAPTGGGHERTEYQGESQMESLAKGDVNHLTKGLGREETLDRRLRLKEAERAERERQEYEERERDVRERAEKRQEELRRISEQEERDRQNELIERQRQRRKMVEEGNELERFRPPTADEDETQTVNAHLRTDTTTLVSSSGDVPEDRMAARGLLDDSTSAPASAVSASESTSHLASIAPLRPYKTGGTSTSTTEVQLQRANFDYQPLRPSKSPLAAAAEGKSVSPKRKRADTAATEQANSAEVGAGHSERDLIALHDPLSDEADDGDAERLQVYEPLRNREERMDVEKDELDEESLPPAATRGVSIAASGSRWLAHADVLEQDAAGWKIGRGMYDLDREDLKRVIAEVLMETGFERYVKRVQEVLQDEGGALIPRPTSHHGPAHTTSSNPGHTPYGSLQRRSRTVRPPWSHPNLDWHRPDSAHVPSPYSYRSPSQAPTTAFGVPQGYRLVPQGWDYSPALSVDTHSHPVQVHPQAHPPHAYHQVHGNPLSPSANHQLADSFSPPPPSHAYGVFARTHPPPPRSDHLYSTQDTTRQDFRDHPFSPVIPVRRQYQPPPSPYIALESQADVERYRDDSQRDDLDD